MKFLDVLKELPVRYFCNYCLLGGVGIAFEVLVFMIRAGVDVSPEMQMPAAAVLLISILQTGAEFFIPEGDRQFFPRLAAALVHTVFFSALVLLQLHLDMPLAVASGLLGLLFWALAFCQIRFPGKGNFLMLPALFFGIFLLLPVLAGALTWLWSPVTLAASNILLFLLTCAAWHKNLRSITKKESAL